MCLDPHLRARKRCLEHFQPSGWLSIPLFYCLNPQARPPPAAPAACCPHSRAWGCWPTCSSGDPGLPYPTACATPCPSVLGMPYIEFRLSSPLLPRQHLRKILDTTLRRCLFGRTNMRGEDTRATTSSHSVVRHLAVDIWSGPWSCRRCHGRQVARGPDEDPWPARRRRHHTIPRILALLYITDRVP